MEKLGVKKIDPNTYHFKAGDHVSVLNTKIPEGILPILQKIVKGLGVDSLPAIFFHHGIFCEYKDNIPFFISQTNKGIVKENAQTFSSGRMSKWRLITKHDYKKFSRERVVKEAEAYLRHDKDFGKYSFLTNNCEHFVYKIIEGEKKCSQIRIVGGGTISLLALLALIKRFLPSENTTEKKDKNNSSNV